MTNNCKLICWIYFYHELRVHHLIYLVNMLHQRSVSSMSHHLLCEVYPLCFVNFFVNVLSILLLRYFADTSSILRQYFVAFFNSSSTPIAHQGIVNSSSMLRQYFGNTSSIRQYWQTRLRDWRTDEVLAKNWQSHLPATSVDACARIDEVLTKHWRSIDAAFMKCWLSAGYA